MTKVFVKKEDLKLGNGKYLLSNGNPVTNPEFVSAQKDAEILVKMAEKSKGMSFKSTKGSTIEELKDLVVKEVNTKAQLELFEVPEKPQTELIDKLLNEAKSFIGHNLKVDKAKSLNNDIQRFKVIHDFETVGLYFDQGLVELNHIYTIDDIKSALQVLYDIIHN